MLATTTIAFLIPGATIETISSLRAQDLSAQDIIFDLNGLEVKRETNIVTDVVPGASFEILKTSTSARKS